MMQIAFALISCSPPTSGRGLVESYRIGRRAMRSGRFRWLRGGLLLSYGLAAGYLIRAANDTPAVAITTRPAPIAASDVGA